MRTWAGESTTTLTLQVLLLIISLSQGIQTVAPLDCRIFPFHPVCRGFNAGKRSGTTSPPARTHPHQTSSQSLISSSSKQVADAGLMANPLVICPQFLSPNVYDILYRKYAFAPKCRGTTSKRSVPNVIPTSAAWIEVGKDDPYGDNFNPLVDERQRPGKVAIQKRSYGSGQDSFSNFYHKAKRAQEDEELAYLSSLPKYRFKRAYHGGPDHLYRPLGKRVTSDEIEQDFPNSFSSIFVLPRRI